ncbi:MAG: glycosyltransferase family 39 protein [Candidatus Aureabacteria bacterium]|nr:glycosyltransferase family 39 protein [Candidatus Auribacterota bacterium]
MSNRLSPFLSVIFLAGLALRLAALAEYRFVGADGGVDGVVLAISGQNLFSGAGFSFQGRPETIHAPLFPILTGLVWKLCGDLELAGQLVSVLAGALLVFPVFLLGRSLYSPRTGLISAAMTAVFPAFIYASTEIRLTSLYALLCATAAWLMYRNAWAGGFAGGCWTGAAIALCYLARPEALLFLPLAGVLPFLVGKHPKDKQSAPINNAGRVPSFDPALLGSRQECRSHKQDMGTIEGVTVGGTFLSRSRPSRIAALMPYLAGIALGFAILSSPYWCFLKRSLGHWTLNGRGPFTFVGYFRDDWDRAYFDLYTYPDQALREWRDQGGMAGFMRKNLPQAVERLARNTAALLSLGESPQIARIGLPPFLVNAAVIVFAVAAIGGGAVRILRRRWLFRDTFLALFMATVLPYLVLTWRDLRYFYPYFPLLLIVLAEGCGRWAVWAKGAGRPRSARRMILAAAPAGIVLLAMLLASGALIPLKIRTVPYEYKLLGLWMRETIPDIEKTVVMSRKMGVPFYAGSRHALIHPGSYSEVIRFAREIDARYLVVDDWIIPSTRPALAFLLDDAPPPPELERVHTLEHAGRRIILYRFKTVPGGV